MQTLEQIIERMKLEVFQCIKIKQIPETVASFSELHEYIDANELGGFCEDNGITDDLIALHGGRDANEGMPEEVLVFMNAAQDAIDVWLKAGIFTA